eukprot:Em0005g1374a
MSEAGVTAGAAAQATELRKHEANDVKCSELGWLCIPLVVESYGAWGKEAMESFSSLASRLAITSSRPKSAVLSELYGRLNLNLVRANAQLSLSRGGLGLRSLMFHAPTAYIASVCSSGYGHLSLTHLTYAVEMFNECVAPADKISLDSITSSNVKQKMLSSMIFNFMVCLTCPQLLKGHAYYQSLPLIPLHGCRLSPQQVLVSISNLISTMLPSNGG